MTRSRRSFLKSTAIFAVTTSVSVPAFAQGQAELTSGEFGRQTLACADPQATFEKWTGGSFSVSHVGKSFGTLVLASVHSTSYPHGKKDMPPPRGYDAVPESVAVPEIRATMLEFEPRRKYLPRGTYTLTHDWLGTFDLLLEPCLYPNGAITYVAVFTRFTGRTATT